MMFRILVALLLLAAPASADNYKNFAKGTVAQGYNAAATAINLQSTHGARFATPPFKASWWNCTDYPSPADDPNREVVRVNSAAADTWSSITRGQEGTVAIDHNTVGKSYCVEQAFYAGDLDAIHADIAAAGGGPQDILNIVAADLQGSLAAAVSTAGSTKALRITNTQTAGANTSFASIPAVWMPCPGKLSWADGLFMDFDRPEQIVAGDCQIFDAKAGVRFAKPGKINPRWWGGGPEKSASVNKTALEQAILSLPDAGANTTGDMEIRGGVYQVDNTISSAGKNFRIQCLEGSGFLLTTSASNRHLFQATGTSSRLAIDGCQLKTSSTIVTDLTMKAFSVDVGGGISSAPAGSVFAFTHNTVEGFNIGFFTDGGSSLVTDAIIDEYNSYKTGGSGGAATNEGSYHVRCVHCLIQHNLYNGDTKGEHGLYVVHPIHLLANGNYFTGYQFEAIKVATYAAASGLAHPQVWQIEGNTLKDNVGSITIEANQSYDVPKVSLDHTKIDGDSSAGSNASAILIQALNTSKIRHMTGHAMSIRNVDESAVMLNTATGAVIDRADLHGISVFNWSRASVGTSSAINSSNANGTKRSLSVSGAFDGNSNGKNIFGVDLDTYWTAVSMGADTVVLNVTDPDSLRLTVPVGASGNRAPPVLKHYQNSTDTQTAANTTETTLDTITIKAKSLGSQAVASYQNGLHLVMTGRFAANTNTKTVRFKFGGTTVISNDKTPAPNGVVWKIEVWIVKKATDSQRVVATMQVDCVNQTPTSNGFTLDDAADITLTVTGQNGTASAGDIVRDLTLSEYVS